uniref:Uncharacterized protein n=1 Tax=Arundo donax TaxID=35708 RepID=A0A0A9GB91_ARUDO
MPLLPAVLSSQKITQKISSIFTTHKRGGGEGMNKQTFCRSLRSCDQGSTLLPCVLLIAEEVNRRRLELREPNAREWSREGGGADVARAWDLGVGDGAARAWTLGGDVWIRAARGCR